ncbi:TetR family transcriptional regulator [Nocardia fluminea]|uniref:TetR family transcriptional regulator n=1 Tax=Nocardia fluminea TaxID=134984 RepID=UPI0034296D54
MSEHTPRQVESIRQRTRRVVTSELLDRAQDLFAEYGYEAVTIDQIAASAGMSKRTFFRYFASKDALVLGKYDRQGQQFAAAIAARPPDEPVWVSLRRMFDGVVEYISDPELAKRVAEMDRVISASETLRAGQLERLQRGQNLVVEQIEKRSNGVITGLSATALVAAAFAALAAAHAHAQAHGVPFDTALDTAMFAVSHAGDSVRTVSEPEGE